MADYRLISMDVVAQVSLGGDADGTAPVYGTALVLGGTRKNLTISESLSVVNVEGGGDYREKVRAKRGKTTITLEKFVLQTGAAHVNALGQYAKLEYKELSSMALFKTYEGIITEWEWSAGDDEQVERITITCDAEHA